MGWGQRRKEIEQDKGMKGSTLNSSEKLPRGWEVVACLYGWY